MAAPTTDRTGDNVRYWLTNIHGGWRSGIRSGTRYARAVLSAAHSQDEEIAQWSPVRPGAEDRRDRSRFGQGHAGLLEADRQRASLLERGEQDVRLLHAEEVVAGPGATPPWRAREPACSRAPCASPTTFSLGAPPA